MYLRAKSCCSYRVVLEEGVVMMPRRVVCEWRCPVDVLRLSCSHVVQLIFETWRVGVLIYQASRHT